MERTGVRQRVLYSMVGLALMGCGSDVQCEDVAEIAPSLELGSETPFEALGDRTRLEYGPQGGQHIYGSLRATGIVGRETYNRPEELPRVSFIVSTDDVAFLGGVQLLPDVMTVNADMSVEWTSLLPIDDANPEGLELQIDAEIVDFCGTRVSASGSTVLTFTP